MTPHSPADETPRIGLPPLPRPAGNEAFAHARLGPRRRISLILLATLLLAGGAAGAWWWSHRPAAATPPLPADIEDPEVRQVVEHARQKVLDKPNDASAWGRLGMVLEAHLYEGEADRCFAEAARLDPADARWPYFRGMYALKTDADHALPFLRQAASLRSAPEDESAVRLRLAEALLERQELDEAEGLFREQWQRRPDNPRVAYALGLIALARGDEAAAEKYLTTALSSPAARRPATAQLAALARARGDEAAAARYEKAAAPRPGDSIAWPDPVVEQILSYQVGANTWSQEAARLEREGRLTEAVQIYQGQIDKQPTVQAYVGAGSDLARMRNYERALPLLREAVRLEPDSTQAHFTLAQVQYTRAETELQQTSDSAPAQEWLREAVEHARRAAELKPDHARAFLIWGLSLKYLGDPTAAVERLRKGVACRPADVELQLALGHVLLETGQDKEAETYLENARKLDPNDERVTRALERLRQKKD